MPPVVGHALVGICGGLLCLQVLSWQLARDCHCPRAESTRLAREVVIVDGGTRQDVNRH
jgi:hypothetical protein